ncbi:helix-turn-helix domain-containing protein [Microbacterium sp. NPDC056234]|uniref:helix-turn-helix domain-containing protein n=1 Tax=Microbacterium sp. NPDC056234 TaxID=3345757 RepID=UPI0035E3B31E
MPTSTAPTTTPSAALAAVRENPPAFLSVPEAAVILDRAPSRVYQLIAAGTCPVQRFGRAVRIPTAAFLAFIDGEG